jgi:hypothetical protein
MPELVRFVFNRYCPRNVSKSTLFSVGFDRNIFTGDPSLADLKKYAPKLTDEEKGKLPNIICKKLKFICSFFFVFS